MPSRRMRNVRRSPVDRSAFCRLAPAPPCRSSPPSRRTPARSAPPPSAGRHPARAGRLPLRLLSARAPRPAERRARLCGSLRVPEIAARPSVRPARLPRAPPLRGRSSMAPPLAGPFSGQNFPPARAAEGTCRAVMRGSMEKCSGETRGERGGASGKQTGMRRERPWARAPHGERPGRVWRGAGAGCGGAGEREGKRGGCADAQTLGRRPDAHVRFEAGGRRAVIVAPESRTSHPRAALCVASRCASAADPLSQLLPPHPALLRLPSAPPL